MRADSFELYLAAAMALMVLAICFAGLLRFSIRHDAALGSLLLRRGQGVNSTVTTLDARYLLPWVSLPASSPLSGAPFTLFWCARLSAWGAVAAVMVGLVISVVR
ncbi:hypothetical protein [Pseudomonas sp.]|uniref:hypothetical protein n=1 Tax=Pseudomonas sp. TaxID=306 RepID=UPI003D12F041